MHFEFTGIKTSLAFMVVITSVLISGCAHRSPAPRLYVLGAEGGWRSIADRTVSDSNYTVRLIQVRMPDYLDRPNLVTRISDNEIKMESFHRWGMPIDAEFKGRLAGEIAAMLPAAYVETSSRPVKGRDEYGIVVDVMRLDGELGGDVELIAEWTLTRSGDGVDHETIVQRISRHNENAGDPAYEVYVETIGNVISLLGREIAGFIMNLEKEASPEDA